jgi:hypothetical protein
MYDDYDYDYDDGLEESSGLLILEDLEQFSCDSSVPDIVRIWSDGDDSRYSE